MGYIKAQSWATGMAGSDGGRRQCGRLYGAGGGEERANRWGPRVSETRERRCREGKHIFEKTPMGRMPNGPAEQSGGLRGWNGLARWTGLVGPDPSGKTNGNLILNFN
jgi:hypothetical protein